MALLVVLFIVMAIAVIGSGFIARSDVSLAAAHNYGQRTQADYLAWGGMEHARALIISPDNVTPLGAWSSTGMQLDATSSYYYDLDISSPAEVVPADPNDVSTYRYSIQCSAYALVGGNKGLSSTLLGDLLYDPNDGSGDFISIRRE